MECFELDWDQDLPVSKIYKDIYYSKGSGIAEIEHVFIQANKISARYSKEGRLKIGELGFGTGLNFLVTWKNWLENGKIGKLEFYSVEKHPLKLEDYGRVYELWPELAEYSEILSRELVHIKEGINEFSFADDQVYLSIYIGDVGEFLEKSFLEKTLIDAWYLDGFSPSKNPEMWSKSVFDAMVLCSHFETTFSTFTAVGQVKRNLRAAGFDVKKIPGYGTKRDMLAGRLDKF